MSKFRGDLVNQAILLVGTENSGLAYLAMLLEQKNYAPALCRQFEEVTHCLEASQFDLVIIDDQKPTLNAIDLCSQLQDNAYTAHIPVILLLPTANGTNEETLYPEQCQFTVRKPVLPHLLIEKVASTLSKSNESQY